MRPPRPALAASLTTSTPNGSVAVVRPRILLADDGAALDITERRRIENAVRESEELFRNMADHVP